MPNRIAQVVQSFLGGAVIAVVVTVVHGESFPWVLGAGLLVVAAFLVSLRLLSDDRIITIAGSLGLLVTVLILAQRSTGGSVLIAATDAGNVWVIGASLLCGLACAWPHISSNSAR
jgi:N-acetyl-1-D-myo-inositol-2-amino-2-deoxy-alpha-D-glucopyranoside deacetylase